MRIQDVLNGRGLILAVTLSALSLCMPAMAQQTLGSITGTVKDISGAVIPGATVSRPQHFATNLEITETHPIQRLVHRPEHAYRHV
jgi:hypothetical protein